MENTFDAYEPNSREIARYNRANVRAILRTWQTASVSDMLKPGFREQLILDWITYREYCDAC